MFNKILIANRSEIACRVAATARRLGIATVAVYSDADADAKHVAACDEAIYLGPAEAKQSYLQGDKIIAIARKTGAQAIHPGYGFLSENEGFAHACAAAHLTFIGPPATAIRAMGSKSAAKALMEEAGVPLVPGYHGEIQQAEFLQEQSDRIGYPVLIKASAGGGGKGMRVVERAQDFASALASCQREARSSFGDDRVLVEKYLLRPRHIEIQVFADRNGQCIYLFERDCSVQRRHQKVLEEAPAPGMSDERRQAMGKAAVAAANKVGYVGAGTVEFIASQDGEFYFMEMNTRLQVEHPVTEMITGFDLVEWQLRVAAGESLPVRQEQLRINGHAIEARIYAENPDKGFLPATGSLRALVFPKAIEFAVGSAAGTGSLPAAVRVDSGVRSGDAITPYYDPMIAKLIVWGSNRTQALARLRTALAQTVAVGLSTNVAFLSRLVASPAFSNADLDTGLIERENATLFAPDVLPGLELLALVLVWLHAHEEASANADPWSRANGWRLNQEFRRRFSFTCSAGNVTAELVYRRSRLEIHCGAHQSSLRGEMVTANSVRAVLGGEVVTGEVYRHGEDFDVFAFGQHVRLSWVDPLEHASESESEDARLTAPMPGKIVAIHVTQGDKVAKGAALVVMEAMKMEHTIFAPADGSVDEILYAVGDQVSEGAQLLTFTHG